MKINSLIIFLFLSANQLVAQQFKAEAKVSNIQTNGLHSLLISPQLRSLSKVDLSDLRLFGADNIEVPYYVWQDSRETSSIGFEEFKIVSKQILPNKSTTIIIENNDEKSISDIIVNIANSDLTKICNISGSYDQKQWFGLLDKYVLTNLENSSNTNLYLPIRLPMSNYRYLKFQINDTNTAPIDILKFGRFEPSLVRSKLISVRPNTVTFKNISSEKQTQILVKFSGPQAVDNVDFQIAKPNLYKRNARIIVIRKIEGEINTTENVQETLYNFELNSSGSNNFDLSILFEKEFIIEIDNEDNPPLEITKVNFSQLPIFIVADLVSGENYTLKTGDTELSTPNYDITNFKIKGIESMPVAQLSELKLTDSEDTVKNSEDPKSFWQKKWFLWVCIGIAGGAIVYFSSTLLKDMRNN